MVGCCQPLAGVEVGVVYGPAEVSEEAGKAGGCGEVPTHYGLGAVRMFHQGAELCGKGLCGGKAAGGQGVGGGVGEELRRLLDGIVELLVCAAELLVVGVHGGALRRRFLVCGEGSASLDHALGVRGGATFGCPWGRYFWVMGSGVGFCGARHRSIIFHNWFALFWESPCLLPLRPMVRAIRSPAVSALCRHRCC
ncbi:hypothetical protein LC603019_00864 [Lawsonella clevelandensis]|uniref:Uncharacterized protein n=1 Tax=Lawsonella clevelandensis TaxID=1528099 RepID=A0A5E3ZYC4_9ACTN|nr:hypothetical protein LC603019_00864 [Lawsonella clevelandensis]